MKKLMMMAVILLAGVGSVIGTERLQARYL